MRAHEPALRALVIVLVVVAASNGRGDESVCKEYLSNTIKCGDEQFAALQVEDAGDGTFKRVQFTQYIGDDAHWRTTELLDSGIVRLTVDNGTGRQSKWWVLHQWIFPRTQRMTIRRVGAHRIAVTDCSGREWILVGTTKRTSNDSMAVARIGNRDAPPAPLVMSDEGIVGVDLAAGGTFTLHHRVPSYSVFAKQDAPAFGRMKSTFIDRGGKRCDVANRELFGTRSDGKPTDSGFLFTSDAELADFVGRRCPALDVAPLRAAVPPAPATPHNYSR